MNSRLHKAIDLLDEGLRLYRNGFLGFIQITSLWAVPVIISTGIFMASLNVLTPTMAFFPTLGWFLLLTLLSFYLVGALSHATRTMQQGQRINVRRSLTISPLRISGMGCYGTLYLLVATVISWGILFFVAYITIFLVLILGSGWAMTSETLGGTFGTVASLLILVVILAIILTVYMFSIVFSIAVSGSTYSSLVYALQPFVQEKLSFLESINRSITMIFCRFTHNLLVFLLASLIFISTALSVATTIGVLLPLPLLWAFGSESLITQGSGIVSWFLGLIVILPPMPIWMTLLYQYNLTAYQGSELIEHIAAASSPHSSPSA